MSLAVPEPDVAPASAEPTSYAPPREWRRSKRVVKRRLRNLLIFALGLAFGLVGGRMLSRQSGQLERMLPQNAQMLKPGPWGVLAKVPLTLSAPEELLPIRKLEAAGMNWFFGGVDISELGKLLDQTGVTAEQRASLLQSATESDAPRSVKVTPADDVMLSLAPEARLAIYRVLMQFRENSAQIASLAASSIDERFQANNVSSETEDLFWQMSCRDGNYVLFAGLPFVLSKIEEYEEKVRFMKALTMQKTFLLRFHLDQHSDLHAMESYWGRGVWTSDVKVILTSLAAVPGGDWSSTTLLMPPIPSGLLYCYPLTQQSTPEGGHISRDCHWTSFNYFRDPPDPRFSDSGFIKEKIREDYSPVNVDPRYGDIVFFIRSDGSIIHSAVYMADDVVYTKNGDTYVYPWMLSTIPELLEFYSAQLPRDQKLTVSYYRSNGS